ncbi:MAG: aminotransferase class I/II-fold pyridoxal phosphate-dependent enzyme, partial [Chlamydiia bacterium]|nr:aminotransferase class I/II-fold pyridoxal phosphate-dependent enzyme [Chlamydiia bacterium]
MVKRNSNFLTLSENYLFPEVMHRVRHFKRAHPERELISLSIGDTSEPLSPTPTEGLVQQASLMGTRLGYRGYGPEQGELSLRCQIALHFYQEKISPDEIFISDGAKCDIGRLQLLFGSKAAIGVQDPTYPVYADTAHILGNSSIFYLPCNAANDFFPDLAKIPKIDLLYFCSPNNPTGAVATHTQLESLVAWAKEHKSFLIFDAAYAGFIQDPSL